MVICLMSNAVRQGYQEWLFGIFAAPECPGRAALCSLCPVPGVASAGRDTFS